MSTTKYSKERSQNFKFLLLMVSALVGLYSVIVFVAMPIYTRHWQRIRVPQVTNLSTSAAEKLIRHAKLDPVKSEIKFDDIMPAGYVIFQNPLADTYVKKGRRIYLTSSKGMRPVTVPKLVGMNVRDARFTIFQNQLTLGKVFHDFNSYYPEGVVIDQAIQPDVEVFAGTALDITVSLGEEAADIYIPNMYGRSLEEASLLLRKSHLTKGQVNYRETSEVEPNLVIYQSREPGTRAARGDSVDIVISKIAGGESGGTLW